MGSQPVETTCLSTGRNLQQAHAWGDIHAKMLPLGSLKRKNLKGADQWGQRSVMRSPDEYELFM